MIIDPTSRANLALVCIGLLLCGCSRDGGGSDAAFRDATTDVASNDTAADAAPHAADAAIADDAPPDRDTSILAEFGLDERPANQTCSAFDRPSPTGSITTEAAFAGLSFSQPTWVGQPPTADDGRWFVLEQAGVVRVFEDDETATTSDVFIDITDRTTLSQERGLLGIAFHPDWPDTAEVFLSYVSFYSSRVSKFTSSDGGATLDPDSEVNVITISQSNLNHNGGNIAFGHDGFLYLGMGDGGGGGDPDENAQDLTTLLGKMVRIDVFGGDPYAIPADNPFAGGGGLPEIYAWGFRNPWRFSFDRGTGELWAGDVGQLDWEEIDVVELGGNYGWDDKEGTHCYEVQPCEDGPWTDPIAEYDHSMGRQAIVGGFVYRGSQIPTLQGVYVFADYATAQVYGVFRDADGDPEVRELFDRPGQISSLGQGLDGELYVVDYATGTLHRIVEQQAAAPSNFPRQLSDTGCVDVAAPDATPGLIPYGVNAPFWSDNAVKTRYIALPDGGQVVVDPSGDWTLPQGAVVVKNFRLAGELVETRLLVHHEDGWGGYSYEWNDAGTDATYVRGGKVKQVAGQDWFYPSSGECMACHTEAAGRTLGLENVQLDGDFSYESTGRVANQLRTFGHIGVIDDVDLDAVAELVDPADDGEPLDRRARSYLHTNCSQCHRSGTTLRPKFDLTAVTDPLIDDLLCDAPPIAGDLGVDGAVRLDPGSPDTSLIWLRMTRRTSGAMPPLGSNIVDPLGSMLISDWIESLGDCEP